MHGEPAFASTSALVRQRGDSVIWRHRTVLRSATRFPAKGRPRATLVSKPARFCIRAENEEYEDARKLWNGVIYRRPALIARAKDAADVMEAVNFARETEVLVSVRGGGHNVAGMATADSGLMIDLSAMKRVEVDPERRTVRAEAGATIGEPDEETQKYGLATPMGVVSETGIAGLTLNAGLGWLRRKHGLFSDNLLSVDLITADGCSLTASESENEGLFWGLRGGGGNFGVVTTFEYRLHPVGPEVMFVFVL